MAHEITQLDAELLEAIVRLDRVLKECTPWNPAIPALLHCQETLALLSKGLEQTVQLLLQEGTENPSWN